MDDEARANSSLRVASMFAGIGGICLGFKQVDCEIVWANEINDAACRTYVHNFGSRYLVPGDIKRIVAASIPDCDILAAGFPCQSFSASGAQRGFNDRRGRLFFEVARIAKEKRPPVLFLENVDNLLDHDSGRTLQIIYAELAQLGYAVRYKIMPSNKYGGLPQPRKRVYLVAFLDWEKCRRFQFPEPLPLKKTIFDVINLNDKKNEIYYLPVDSDLARRAAQAIDEPQYVYRVFDGKITKLKNRLAPTLTASMVSLDNTAVVKDAYGIRRLTLRECLAFQGFPEAFYFPNTITLEDAYKQIGNSVSVPVIKRIAENLVQVLIP